jgi:hypothetical protein
MASAASEHNRRRMYDHSRSKEIRRGPPPADEVGKTKSRHHDERVALGAEHYRESQALEQKIRQEKARDVTYHEGKGDDAYDRQRADLRKRHKEKKEAQERRHSAELEAAARRSHIE